MNKAPCTPSGLLGPRGLVILLALTAPLASAQEPTPAKQVLIAAEASGFKDAVVAQVATTLRDDGHQVKIIELEKLPTEPARDYQAIVLINTCRAWRPTREVRDFLKQASANDRNKLVVVTTAAGTDCALNVSGVDTISAASKPINIEAVAQSVIEKVRAHLATP
jgi:hypothetical protein